MLNKKDNLIIFVLALLVMSLAVFVMTGNIDLNKNKKISIDKKLNIGINDKTNNNQNVNVSQEQKDNRYKPINKNTNNNTNTNQNLNTNQQTKIIIDGVDVSDWNIYRNEEYGYSIRYPKDWSEREFPNTKTGADLTGNNCKIIIDAGGAGGEEHLNDPFDEYIYIAHLGTQNVESLNTIEKIITDSNIEGYITTWNGSRGISSEIVYFEANKQGHFKLKVIEIHYGSEPTEYCSKMRNTMIKTFDYIK
ncbi:hypothetical protein K8R61_02135 [bacterium]|nr:hypothetical protein [bacterium]